MALQTSLHQAAQTLAQIAAGACSKYVITHDFTDCTPEKIVAAVNRAVCPEFQRVGLGEVEFFLTDFVTTNRTYRLVQNAVGLQGYFEGRLSTVSEQVNAATSSSASR